jgi:hypothetical protein
VAAPPVKLGAHIDRIVLTPDRYEFRVPQREVFRLHVLLVSALTLTAELAYPYILYAFRLKHLLKPILVEVRIALRAGKAPYIGESLYAEVSEN